MRADTKNRDSEKTQRAIMESILRHRANIQRADTESRYVSQIQSSY